MADNTTPAPATATMLEVATLVSALVNHREEAELHVHEAAKHLAAAKEVYAQISRLDFLDALESYSDGYIDQRERLFAAAERVASDDGMIRNENAGFFLAQVMGYEQRFVGLTFDHAAKLIIDVLANDRDQEAA